MAIERKIVDWFEAEKKAAPTSEARLLLERMCALIKRGGKRARPGLFYLTYRAYGGKYATGLLDIGLALELHHQYLLVHDDLMDNDTVRYDGPNIVGYYLHDEVPAGQGIPESMGLLAGDLLCSYASQSIVASKHLSATEKISLLDAFNNANEGVAYGQQLDIYNVAANLPSFTEDRLLLIHSLKTALYSTKLPMRCAAILLHLDTTEREKIDEFAKQFGLLFQFVDDYSDYFENQSAFNDRPKYRDYRQGKITYPLYVALTLASRKEIEALRSGLGDKGLSDESLRGIVDILVKCGAQEASRTLAESYASRTLAALEKLSVTADFKQQYSHLLERYRI